MGLGKTLGGILAGALLAPAPAFAYSCVAIYRGDCDADRLNAEELARIRAINAALDRLHKKNQQDPGKATGQVPGQPANAGATQAQGAPAPAPSGVTVTPIPGQPGIVVTPLPPLNEAGTIDKNAELETFNKVGEARKRSSRDSFISGYERSLADSIANSYDSIQNYVRPRQNSPDAAQRAEAASRLAQPVSVPEAYSQVYPELGLQTNQDLLDQGPQYVENLSNDSDELAAEASRLRKQADEGEKAVKAMNEFRRTLDQRTAGMASVDADTLLAAPSAAAPAAHGARGAAAAPSASTGGPDSSNISGDRTPDLVAGGGAKAVAAPVAARAGGSTVDLGGASRAPASLDSLRDRLRRHLAEAGTTGGGAKAGPGAAGAAPAPAKKSAFSSFFEEGSAKEEEAAAAAAAAEHASFFLSGPETDRAVAKFMGNLEGTRGGNEVFGSADISIFQRMRAFLKKCQAEKKVAGR
jgi:hypothetical protein